MQARYVASCAEANGQSVRRASKSVVPIHDAPRGRSRWACPARFRRDRAREGGSASAVTATAGRPARRAFPGLQPQRRRDRPILRAGRAGMRPERPAGPRAGQRAHGSGGSHRSGPWPGGGNDARTRTMAEMRRAVSLARASYPCRRDAPRHIACLRGARRTAPARRRMRREKEPA